MTNEYKEILKTIQNSISKIAVNVNLQEPIINIDWNTRIIELPKQLQQFIAIQNDHQADTIYFCVDRYFDDVDLSTMTCVIEYINAKNEGRISPILDIDIQTDPTKIYFGWKLSRSATKEAGTIIFAPRFYAVDSEDNFIYNIGARPCAGIILKAIGDSILPGQDDDEDLKVDDVLKILDRLNQLEEKMVSWIDLEE